MDKRENPTALRSKKWLTEALLSLMKEKTYDSIKIVEISKRADLTRQTFYQNFDSKAAALNYHLDQLFELFLSELQKKDIHTSKELTICYLDFWSRYDSFINLIIKNDLSWILLSKFPQYLDKLMTLIHIEKNSNSVDTAKYAYTYISGALANVLIYWVGDGKRLSIEQISTMVEDIHNGKYLCFG